MSDARTAPTASSNDLDSDRDGTIGNVKSPGGQRDQSRVSVGDSDGVGGQPASYRKLRAPLASGAAMIEPPLVDSELILKSNLDAASEWDSSPTSLDLASLRVTARQQLVADALIYTRRYRDVSVPTDPGTPVIMAGHQPSLFHPGVWMKNRVLSTLADQCGGLPINLVVDNDVCSSSVVRVPTVDEFGRAMRRSIRYDDSGGGVPYEQTVIKNAAHFDMFDRRLSDAIKPLVANPLVTELWQHARKARSRCDIAGCALAQARHTLEADMGWQTIECPVGVATRGVPFARFVVAVLEQIEAFTEIYNNATESYRLWHGIRSSAHPVPNLGRDGSWFELPLWLYGNSDPQRRGVWVRRVGSGWEWTDRNRRTLHLHAGEPEDLAAQIADAGSPEFKLRPRALMTTMFARLVLSDLFLHGIGGGKYDQLADQIIRQFFRIEPPQFQVVSATIRLPGTSVDSERHGQLADVKRRLRESIYQGERYLDASDPLVRRKRTLLNQIPPVGQRKSWHREIVSINSLMAEQLRDKRRQW
ncbi:MAG: hypothetical protein AAF745_17500, partial [Planctomycetota bacterium]